MKMTAVAFYQHPFGLCRKVHLAGEPQAVDCVACAFRADKKALCAVCKASQLKVPKERM
jgi:hypothetical protein